MQQEIYKCPACGRERIDSSIKCDSCGYNFLIDCKLINELNNKFDSINEHDTSERKQRKLDIITTFAIPQVSEELLNLLIYIQPKTREKNSDITDAWRSRQREVINRAKIAFTNDRQSLAIILEYEKELNKLEKQYIRRWWQKMPIIGKVGVILGIIFILLIIIPAKDISPEAYAERFSNAVQDKKYDKAMGYLKKCPDMGDLISEHYLALIADLVEENRVVEAEILYNDLDNFVSRSKYKSKISKIHNSLINYHLTNDNIDKAMIYAKDVDGIISALRYMIENDDTDMAIKFYRKNSHKLSEYNSRQRKRVLKFNDDVVEEFIMENNLLR